MMTEKHGTTIMRRWLVPLLVLTLLLPLGSCRRKIEKARSQVRVEAVERVRRVGLTGLEVVLRVQNGLGFKLGIKEAQVTVHYGSARVATAQLREPVEVQRRSTESVTTRWQVKVGDPLALLGMLRDLRNDDWGKIFLSFEIAGRRGLVPVNISRTGVPLSEFLNTFGLTAQQLMNYLK